MTHATDTTEWYWCNDCEEREHDSCGFSWDEEDGQPECPECGSTDVQA